MNIVIDLTAIDNFFALPIDQQLLIFLLRIGWIPIAIMFLYGFVEAWVFWRSNLWSATLKFTLVALDIPRGNDQSLRAVENLFSYLGGAHDPSDLIEKYWIGKYQLNFSFEIVSIEGYIQYLIRTPTQYLELVESAIYSQYPDAEITEVDDYTDGIPTYYPDDEWNIWGGEMILKKSDVYPIVTYQDFEHQMGLPEKQFKDPMATLMDTMSSMKKGEQLWYQILVYPTEVNYLEEKGAKEISKILKEKTSKGKGVFGEIFGEIGSVFSGILGELTGQTVGGTKEEKKDDALKMMNLKPKEKKQVEAIQHKISKQTFETKIRFIYVAKKEIFAKIKATMGFIGFMKQFLDVDLNNLKPDMNVTVTTSHYLFVEARKNERKRKLMYSYKSRSGTRGRARFAMNTEELATIWHVPIESVVRAPLIQKASGRKKEPPMSLPLSKESAGEEIFERSAKPAEDIFEEETQEPIQSNEKGKIKDVFALEEEKKISEEDKGKPPTNLPFA